MKKKIDMIPKHFLQCDFLSWGVTRTVLATVAAHGNSICVGLSQGFSAVLLPQIADPGSMLTLTSQEASWVASLGVISNPLGAVIAGAASEVFGRRAAVRLAAAPYLIGWLLIALSDDFLKLCIGRFISGVAVGMATSSYVYVAEISGAKLRGTLCASGPVFVSVGVLLVYVAGAFTNWTTVAALSCIASALAYAGATAILPETPPWLVSRGRSLEAKASLQWLRGTDSNIEVEKELAALVDAANAKDNDQESKKAKEELSSSSPIRAFFVNLFLLFTRPQVWKPFVLLTFFFAFQEASGIYVLLYYAVDLFRSLEAGRGHPISSQQSGIAMVTGEGTHAIAAALVGSPNLDGQHAEQVTRNMVDESSTGIAQGFLPSIAVAGVRLVASIGGAALMQRFGRRQLAMASGGGMAVAMAVAGGYEYAFASSLEERPWPWVPLACVLTHVCVSMIGFLQLPWVMTSELFPQAARGIAGGSVSALAHLLIFASVKTYPDLEAWAGVPYTLWIFSGAAACGAAFVYLFLPETKGKTLAQIEEEFVRGKKTEFNGKIDKGCITDDPPAVLVMKLNNNQNPQNKEIFTTTKEQYVPENNCRTERSTEDQHSKGVLQLPLSPINLQIDNLDYQFNDLGTNHGTTRPWYCIHQQRKNAYVAGIGAVGVASISITSIDQNDDHVFNSFNKE